MGNESTTGKKLTGGAALASIAAAVVMVGCGGTTNNSTNVESTAIPITTNQRMFSNGDAYTWNITGTETPKGGQAESITGNRTYDIVSVTPAAGYNTVVVKDTYVTSINGGNPTTTSNTITLQQSTTDGSLKETSYTDNGTTVNVTSPNGYKTFGAYSTGETVNGTQNFSNGNSETIAIDVEEQDPTTVNVLSTSWHAWTTVAHTALIANGENDTSTVTAQVAPALGQPLQETVDETDFNGTMFSETLTLTQTSIPPTQWGVNPKT